MAQAKVEESIPQVSLCRYMGTQGELFVWKAAEVKTKDNNILSVSWVLANPSLIFVVSDSEVPGTETFLFFVVLDLTEKLVTHLTS